MNLNRYSPPFYKMRIKNIFTIVGDLRLFLGGIFGRIFIVPKGHQIFKTPVTDASGDIFNRRIKHHAGCTKIIFPAAVAFPFFAVKPLAAKNVFALDALSNHFCPRLIINNANVVPIRNSCDDVTVNIVKNNIPFIP